MFDKIIKVNDLLISLRPYSEARAKQLRSVNEEINAYIEKHPDQTIDELSRKLRASWYRKKAEVLWEPKMPYPDGFFESEEFEMSLLKDTEDFFMRRKLYL